MTPAPNWNIKQHLLYLIVDPEFGHWEANKAPSCSLLIPTLCLSLVCWVCCSRSWSWCLLTSLHQLLGQWFYQDSVKFRFLGGHNGLEGITRAKRLQGGFMCTPEHSGCAGPEGTPVSLRIQMQHRTQTELVWWAAEILLSYLLPVGKVHLGLRDRSLIATLSPVPWQNR